MAIRPKQLAGLLAKTIEARLPVLITGAPGIGKTALVEQAADAAGADMIVSHPVVADPTDAKGLPFPNKTGTEAHFLPFGELATALKAKKPTVWLLDDLGQASPAVQASFMNLILARRINGHRLPECVTFVAATNRRTDRAGVSGILEPVKSRFATIVELQANLEDWQDWAVANSLPWELVSFMDFRGNKPAPESKNDPFPHGLLHAFNATVDLTNSPCPRTWAYVARLMDLGFQPDVELAAIAGAVGEGAAAEFIGFLRICRELPSFDSICMNPGTEIIPAKPAALYATAVMIASRANVHNMDAVATYINRIAKDHGEIAALAVRDMDRRKSVARETGAYQMLMRGPVGKLVRGE